MVCVHRRISVDIAEERMAEINKHQATETVEVKLFLQPYTILLVAKQNSQSPNSRAHFEYNVHGCRAGNADVVLVH